ncbi:putative oxygenase [Streptomyces ambofaciens ATCC 23877]|uniref:Monooxygenase n=2 Tax=Streptomyces ambofaciens TaxID=1889 RepID=Q6VMI4_STRAM|nr:FAD-dependent monooxygenase [Streptomyces ambofaciens]6J0Z_C Chain C, Putative angucycline-like polyketide oxygenase [Streptomyces ambofaciens]AAR30155.1 putative oxygenase [Streptomyces ambofaciens ATCC 23877]AKZ53248.1 putative oxygenase [Streptomyces ambofaciens ATCC 23877]AKZ60515.1 putative oxygenase [Streptomyces ambofaciens ATCC 23877]ANB04137.1 monooxygenase [Streptomyces ambofaciens]ANB10703.1 monooxygenase [Streptomyces ambofaciens]
MEFYDSDVVVVGAGPTGLMLAGELRLAGVSVVVLDKLAEPIKESRALGFSARTIEEFAQRGLMDRFGEVGVIPVGHFGGVPLDYQVIEGGSYGARGIPQARTEGILGGWARELGAEVRRGYEVTAIEDTGTSVTVEAAGADGSPLSLRARYVVGCDGARSSVRKLAGIDFPGTEPAIELRFADVAGVQLRPRFSGERVPGGMVMVLPMGPDRCRVIYFDSSQPLRTAPEAITFEEVADSWQRLTGEDISGATPLWVSSATDVSRQAAQYRKGRVFLAGDAAHIHLPIGAQGMSAGVQDAVNLGWKLALDISGRAPQGLLDTYHSERHPVGQRILTNTLAQRILYLGGDEITPMREVLAELMGSHVSVQRHLAGMVTGLDIRHDVGEGDHPLLGRRLPDRELVVDGEKIPFYSLLRPGRAVLLELGGDRGLRTAAAGWADRVDLVAAEFDGCEAPVDGILVRPDGYVAWVAALGAGADGLTTALDRWFGPTA